MKIGLTVMLANTREDNAKRSYDSIRTVAQEAENDGFDSIWLPDHLLYRVEGQPTRGVWECWTMLAALAEATRHVEIGPLVSCNSFRNPVVLAKMATSVDEISHGRLTLGIGAGWNEPEYHAAGLPFDHLVSRLEESLKIIKPLLREGHTEFSGKYYEAKNSENIPRGARQQGPPLMIGSVGRGRRMSRLTAQYADIWNTGYMGKPETMVEPIAKIRAACRRAGRDPATLGISALIGLWFPDLQPKKPSFIENSLGSVEDIAETMRGYARLDVQQIMFQVEPYSTESRQRLAEALKLYRNKKL